MGTYLSVDESALAKANEALRAFQQPNMDKLLRRAAAAGAGAYRAPLRAASPVKRRGGTASSKTVTLRNGKTRLEYGNPGDLRDSIAQRRVKADGFGISAVVGPMGKRAFMRHWVVKGTRPHRIPQIRLRDVIPTPWGPRSHVMHPGARPNPFVARVGAANRQRSRDAMARAILSGAKKLGGG